MKGLNPEEAHLLKVYDAHRNGCKTGKRFYKKRNDAQAEAGRLNKNKLSVIRVEAYRCRTCGLWHVGRPKIQ